MIKSWLLMRRNTFYDITVRTLRKITKNIYQKIMIKQSRKQSKNRGSEKSKA